MSPLPTKTFQAMLDQFYSKREAIKISEAMYNPYDQRYDKKHKLLIDYLANELTIIWEKCDQSIKQAQK